MVNPPPPVPPPPMEPGEFEFEPMPPDQTDAREKVNFPALALIFYGGLTLLANLIRLGITIANTFLGMTLPNLDRYRDISDLDPQFQQLLNASIGASGIFGSLIGLAIGGAMIFGAMKMRNLEQWGFALAAAILAIVPCFTCCCLIGIPIGIWATVVLLDANVKAAFRS